MTKPLRDAAAEIVRLDKDATPAPWTPGALSTPEVPWYAELGYVGNVRAAVAARNAAPALADWALRARKVIGRIASETPHLGGHAMDCSDCKLWALMREFDGEGRRDG